MCQYTICHLYLSEWSKWRKIKRNSVFRSMFVFMFRYLLQNVAKMTESTPSRHCLPWKHFMQYAYTCLQGFYVKLVYHFLWSFLYFTIPSCSPWHLQVSRNCRTLQKRTQTASTEQGQSLSHPYLLTRDQKGNREGKKEEKRKSWNYLRQEFISGLPAYLLFLQQSVVSSSGMCALLWCPIFKLISKASHPLVQATNAIIQVSLNKQK